MTAGPAKSSIGTTAVQLPNHGFTVVYDSVDAETIGKMPRPNNPDRPPPWTA